MSDFWFGLKQLIQPTTSGLIGFCLIRLAPTHDRCPCWTPTSLRELIPEGLVINLIEWAN